MTESVPVPTAAQLQAALTKTEQLAPAPRTLGRALHLLRDPDSGLYKIAELISSDSGLAVDVLRCANSAYYGRKIRVGAVDEAVQVIGFHETIRLVSLVAVHQTTNRDLSGYGIPAEDFWAESLFNGLFLEALAQQTGGLDRGEAYTAGLLRFVGRLAIDQVLRDFGGTLTWDHVMPLPAWERTHVGTTQAEIGAQLMRKWRFPETIVAATAAQDLPERSLLPPREPLVYAMNFVAQILPAGTTGAWIEAAAETELPFPAEHPFAVAHRLTAELMTDVKAQACRGFASVKETLYQ